MSNISSTSTGTKQQISRNVKFLMAGIIVVATAVGAVALFQPSPMTGRAARVDTLSLQREVTDRDEAAFAASWAKSRAPELAATSGAASASTSRARLLALDQSLFAVVGTSDSATAHTNRLRTINETLYPDARPANASTRDQRLLDLNNWFFPAGPAVNSDSLSLQQAEIASYDAHRDQWMVEWAAYYAKQLEALDAAARHALIEQSIATWTELNVTQLALDQSLFAVVGTSDSATAHTNRLRAINASLYPDDRPASASTRDQRLLDLNNRFYPAEAEACNLACQYIIQQEELDMCEGLCVP